MLVTNWESSELFLYTFKPVCRTSFESLWERLQNLLGMKLTTDVTILCLSALDNDIFVYFLCHNYGLKLTESINICHFSYRFATTIKVNNFYGKRCFPKNVYLVNGLYSENKIPSSWQNIVFCQRESDSCYSVYDVGSH